MLSPISPSPPFSFCLTYPLFFGFSILGPHLFSMTHPTLVSTGTGIYPPPPPVKCVVL